MSVLLESNQKESIAVKKCSTWTSTSNSIQIVSIFFRFLFIFNLFLGGFFYVYSLSVLLESNQKESIYAVDIKKYSTWNKAKKKEKEKKMINDQPLTGKSIEIGARIDTPIHVVRHHLSLPIANLFFGGVAQWRCHRRGLIRCTISIFLVVRHHQGPFIHFFIYSNRSNTRVEFRKYLT